MAPQVVAVLEFFCTQGTDVGPFALRLLLGLTLLWRSRSSLGGLGLGGLCGWSYLPTTTTLGDRRLLLFQGGRVYR